MSSGEFFNEDEVNKIFDEITDSLGISPNIQQGKDSLDPEGDENLSLSLREMLLLQQCLLEAQNNIYNIIFSFSAEEEDNKPDTDNVPDSFEFASSNKINYYFAAMYKIVEDFNDFMLQFVHHDIEFIIEDDEEED